MARGRPGLLGVPARISAVMAALLVATAPMVVAQGKDDGYEGAGNDAWVIGQLNWATEYCGWVADPYRIDCLSDQYQRIGRDLPRDAAYGDLQKALKSAARELRQVAEANRDPAIAPAVPEVGRATGGEGASRPLVAIAAGRKAALGAARDILSRTETLLLRSAETSAARKRPFQRIAAAFGSAKTLLRS